MPARRISKRSRKVTKSLLLPRTWRRCTGKLKPAVTAPISEHDASTVNRLIETLEEHDDVMEVYTNAEFSSGAGC